MKLKKMAAMVMAAVLSVSVLAGCGGGGSTPSNATVQSPTEESMDFTQQMEDAVAGDIGDLLSDGQRGLKDKVNTWLDGLTAQEGYNESFINQIREFIDNHSLTLNGKSVDSDGLNDVLQAKIQETVDEGDFDISSTNAAESTCVVIATKMAEAMNLESGKDLLMVTAQPENSNEEALAEQAEMYANLILLYEVQAQSGVLGGLNFKYEAGVIPVEVNGMTYYMVAFGILLNK